jgi:hypothetical protein
MKSDWLKNDKNRTNQIVSFEKGKRISQPCFIKNHQKSSKSHHFLDSLFLTLATTTKKSNLPSLLTFKSHPSNFIHYNDCEYSSLIGGLSQTRLWHHVISPHVSSILLLKTPIKTTTTTTAPSSTKTFNFCLCSSIIFCRR